MVARKCRKPGCKGVSKQGLVLQPVVSGSPDFADDTGFEAGCTLNQAPTSLPGEEARLVGCWKCPGCGARFL